MFWRIPIQIFQHFSTNPSGKSKFFAKVFNFLSCNGRLIKEVRFKDRYYDTRDYVLTTKDIWLRQRDSNWQCKVPVGFCAKKNEKPEVSMVDQYLELETDADIINFMKENSLGTYSLPANQMDIFVQRNKMVEFASIESVRRKFSLREFVIDLDMTNFGYGIGEVELLLDSEDQVPIARQKVEEFCKEFGLTTGVRGKVLEYLYRNSPKHFAALLESGLVGQKLGLQK